MPTFSYSDFVPSKYLVRIESRELTSCQKIAWETELTEVVCYNWQEAQEVFEFTFENWKDYVRSAHSDPEYWTRTRDCFVGEWTIDVFHSNALHPRKFAVDCQVYVCFTPKDPAERDVEWGESDIWMAINNHLFHEIEAVYGLGTEPEPEPEPEQEYQPETLLTPIPSWDYVETEPEPEPVKVTRGYLNVSLELHDQFVSSRKSYNLPLERELALSHAKWFTKHICDQITNLIGFQPETNQETQSPNWGETGAYNDWWTGAYQYNTDYYQCGICKVTFEWGFDHDSAPIEAEEIESWTEPLWLGCITVDLPYGKRSSCSAHAQRSAIAEWLKGSADAYALISGRMPEEAIGRYTLIEIARDGEQSQRDINITIGDLIGEGIRLI